MENNEEGVSPIKKRDGAYSWKIEKAAINNAIHRCTNPTHNQWKDYGGRGIRVCDEWIASRQAFCDHIGKKTDPSWTLDRIDNDKGYEPGNVRWTTRSEQQLNRRQNFNAGQVVINGVSRTIREWAEISGLSATTIRSRIHAGKPEASLLQPANPAYSRGRKASKAGGSAK